jgi:hypothetical protein
MKIIILKLISVLCLSINLNVNAQIYLQAVAPLMPGNLWKYYDISWFSGQSNYFITDSIKIIDNITYYIVEQYQDKNPTRYVNYFGMTQDSFYARYHINSSDSIYRYYKEDCKIGDSWIEDIDVLTFYYSVIDTFTINAWGKTLFSRVIKITDYSLLVEVYQVWADSIGLMEENSIGQHHMILRGCVINGVVYGDTTTVDVNDDFELPETYTLFQNYPNPFNPLTKISFYLPFGSNVSLRVYNLLGEEVSVLLNNEFKSSGNHSIVFNAEHLPSGVYIYTLQADGKIFKNKMTLMK